ncbi:MAG: pseudouridine synthase [Dysgonamonadaceae bacterium]|jgi:23S rRNA pseudouridine2605 synthase|nr:pseudouridine synthase [Dysgonamonadaceae bacterium]MDD3308497.1 pseudouridine synthase [Dysgonamonadaceae bacterium]MDD3899641.1 pseudouridine synthase [Dysgonamonadaceae bacterium]MDD4398154.1 pseudouridine synthase [Dysgonamonadaceae bacterium]MEA5081857.1 pseudouridine synthase [Dysgonamonadaceae bacterium]
MTAFSNDSRSNRNYDDVNNERHNSSNESGNYRRRPQSGYSDNSYERNYRQPKSYRPRNETYGEGQGQSDEAGKKRRPRVGERISQNVGGNRPRVAYSSDGAKNYPNRGNSQGGGYQNDQRKIAHPKLAPKKKKIFKQIKYKENADPTAPIRLNKYLANAGVCSRREADEFIQAGVVKVNGQVITELGTKITRADEVMFHDQNIKLESKVYVLLNKPKGFVTTTDDPENRKTVMDLVKSACSERIYPVGRLDRGTTGVLLLTNDGDLASKLTHPKYEKRKIYQVWLDKPVTMEHMQAIADGIELEDGEIHADAISYVSEEDLTQIGIEIHSGKNRVVRRIFEKLGYHVVKLDRVYFAGLTKKNLSRGKWRYLTEKEVNMLRMGAFD